MSSIYRFKSNWEANALSICFLFWIFCETEKLNALSGEMHKMENYILIGTSGGRLTLIN